jgi:chorismate mutase
MLAYPSRGLDMTWHTYRRDPQGALLFLRLRESGSRGSRLNERPTRPGLPPPGAFAFPGWDYPEPDEKDSDMSTITAERSNMTRPTDPDAAAAADERIAALRKRIDEIDSQLIALWQERAACSQEVGATRVASGGTRLVLAREREILERYRTALGADGVQLALLLLRAGRGPL